jgi:hypothetical protein
LIFTYTPGSGLPSSAEVTVPLSCMSCANEQKEPNKSRHKIKLEMIFISFVLGFIKFQACQKLFKAG